MRQKVAPRIITDLPQKLRQLHFKIVGQLVRGKIPQQTRNVVNVVRLRFT
jgi:hypothetical protein